MDAPISKNGCKASVVSKRSCVVNAISIATPACGIKVNPKYFTTVGGALTLFALKYAPETLPITRTTR